MPQISWVPGDLREYKDIPRTTINSIINYVRHGHAVGDFLAGVLSNDLRKTFWHADGSNARVVGDIVKFLFNRCPSGCWGSKEKFEKWIAKGGLEGD